MQPKENATTDSGLVKNLQTRLAERPAWEAGFAKLGLLGRGAGAARSNCSASTLRPDQAPAITSTPPIYGRRTSGTRTEPSCC